MRDNLESALGYAALGWRVVPLHTPCSGVCDCRKPNCPSTGKHPRITDWVRHASVDAVTVGQWYEQWPEANVGIATGPESGVIVLDVDPRHGGDEELQRLIGQHGLLPWGPICYTGGGGQHYYYQHPGGKVLSHTIAPGIDVKADGGQVVAPPSVHSTGLSYEWYEGATHTEALPVAPDWLLLLMHGTYRGVDGKGEIPEDVPPGGRNNALTRYGGTLRAKGMGEALIFKLLMAINEEWSQPLDRTEVAQVAASICRYEPQGEAFIVSSKPKREKPLPRPYSIVDLQGKELPPIKWAVPGLFAEGLGLLAGPPKIGKSWLTLDLGIAIAEGGIVFGEVPVEDGDVLVLALEDNERRLQSRMKAKIPDGVWPQRLYVATEWPNQDDGGVMALDAFLGQHPATRLVVIDTFAKFRPVVETRKSAGVYADDYKATEDLQRLAAKHGVCVLCVTHFNKAPHEDWINQITGSSGLTGGVDSLVGLFRKRNEKDGVMKLSLRDGEDGEYAMEFTGSGWTMLGDADEYQMGQEAARVFEVLRTSKEPMKAREIAPLIGKALGAVHKLLWRMAERGTIKSFGGGFYGLRDDDRGLPRA